MWPSVMVTVIPVPLVRVGKSREVAGLDAGGLQVSFPLRYAA